MMNLVSIPTEQTNITVSKIFGRILYAQLLYSCFVFMTVWRPISVKSKKMQATFERCTQHLKNARKLTVKSCKDRLCIDLLHVVFANNP